MSLKFSAAAKPTPISAEVQRRQRLISRIDQQIVYCAGLKAGQTIKASWIWMDETGIYFIPIKYGRHPIELKKGMFSIQCKSIEECESALGTVRSMVLKGELDSQMTKVAEEIRRKFNKTA